MSDHYKELSYLTLRQRNLQEQLKQIESILDIYEQLHTIEARCGESFLLKMPGVEKAVVNNFLAGDWYKKVEQFKETYQQLFIIERRICELNASN